MLDPGFKPEDYEVMSLEEAIKWCYRHEGQLDFARDKEGRDILYVIVPIPGHADNACGRIMWIIESQAEAVEKFVTSVERLQAGLGLE